MDDEFDAEFMDDSSVSESETEADDIGEDGDPTDAGDDFSRSRSVTQPGLINAEALAAAVTIGIDDSLVRSILESIGTMRQLYGPKEELIDRALSDIEASFRCIVMEMAQRPEIMLAAVFRAGTREDRTKLLATMERFINWANRVHEELGD